MVISRHGFAAGRHNGAMGSRGNGGLPRRPVQHQLEDASRAAFAHLVPQGWSLQDRSKDYGIDVDVEVFSEDEATGLRFGVQLKATASAGTRPSVAIRGASLRYWLAQDSPVLLCFWDQETDRLWGRWAHHIDIESLRAGTDSLTVAFDESELWNEQTPIAVEAELRARRLFRDPHDAVPLGLTCTGAGSIGHLSAGLVARRVRDLLRPFGEIVDLNSRQHDLEIDVRVQSEAALLTISGGTPKYLHYDSAGYGASGDSPDETDDLAYAIVVMVALQLRQANLVTEAGALVSAAFRKTNFAPLGAVFPCVEILAQSGRMDEAIELVGMCVRSGGGTGALFPLAADGRGDANAEAIARAIQGWASEAEGSGSLEEASQLAYNSANRWLTSNPAAAVVMYEDAARLDPSYRERDYWWQEYGGALFLSNRPGDSAAAYGKALKLREDLLVRCLLGDALLFAGRFRDASRELDHANAIEELPYAEYRLKSRVARALAEISATESQEREPDRAWEYWLNTSLSEEDAIQALGIDALCIGPLLALAEWREERGDAAGDFYLAAAFVARGDAGIWLRALGAVVREDPDHALDVLFCARDLAGEGVFDLVAEIDGAPLDDFLTVFRALPARRARPPVLRHTSFGSSTYETVAPPP